MSGNCSVGLERIVSFALGELGAEESAAIELHLGKGCPHCAGNLDWVHKVEQVLQTEGSVRPEPSMVRRTLGLLKMDPPGKRAAAPLLSRMLVARCAAVLVYDSSRAAAAVGVRGAGRFGGWEERQLVYSGGGLEVDLQIKSGDRKGTVTMMGQVLQTDDETVDVAGAEVGLGHESMEELTHLTDAFGEFAFALLPHGPYSLRIRARDRQLDIAELHV